MIVYTIYKLLIKVYNAIDIINIRKLYTEVNIMPKY